MIKKVVFFVALFMSVHVSAVAADDTKGNEHWACHMITASGVSGLAMVDTREKAKALDVAVRAKALNEQGVWEPSKRVVECVRMPGGKFRDETFQARYSIMMF